MTEDKFMIRKLFITDASMVSMFSRLVLGLVLFPHGAQKLLGLFGGYGFSSTLDYLTGTVGLPLVIAFLVIVIESFGALALVIGAGTRLAALGVAAVMIGAVVTVHAPNGFFMDWFGTSDTEGFEYHLLALGLALPLIATGGGRASVDRVVAAAEGGAAE